MASTSTVSGLRTYVGLPSGANASALAVVIVGLAALFLPTYMRLADEVWHVDAHGHGPLILGVCLWLLWHDRMKIFAGEARPDLPLGFTVLILGLAAHAFGYSQSLNMVTTGMQPVIFAAALLLVHGRSAVKAAWFPLFFMLFMVPLPETVVQGITMPLKYAVSVVTEWLLYHAGYPVGRNGVTLTIGQYQLLVADACSGMNSLLTLESLGLLYMRLMNYTSKSRNLFLAIAIIPTSFLANVTRVVILVLVTYYYGDEVGQGFVHSFSGLVLFAVSLVGIYFIDRLAGLFWGRGEKRASASGAGKEVA